MAMMSTGKTVMGNGLIRKKNATAALAQLIRVLMTMNTHILAMQAMSTIKIVTEPGRQKKRSATIAAVRAMRAM